jgi:hypothetical protein
MVDHLKGLAVVALGVAEGGTPGALGGLRHGEVGEREEHLPPQT